jgi:hypothetical protein
MADSLFVYFAYRTTAENGRTEGNIREDESSAKGLRRSGRTGGQFGSG